jgi:hypothetical protein
VDSAAIAILKNSFPDVGHSRFRSLTLDFFSESSTGLLQRLSLNRVTVKSKPVGTRITSDAPVLVGVACQIADAGDSAAAFAAVLYASAIVLTDSQLFELTREHGSHE